MNKITINPHYCSREEYQELIDYLESQCWDYSTEESKSEPDIQYRLGENSINGVKIQEVIFEKELFDYTIEDREDFIDKLIGWIAECKNSSKTAMMQDLKMLMNVDEQYMFSSISTNEYVMQGDLRFNELCDELLELNQKYL